MEYQLSQHARDVLLARKIPLDWMERTLREPELTKADGNEEGVHRYFRRIQEHENRVLRVAVNRMVAPQRVISVYFDRAMKGKL